MKARIRPTGTMMRIAMIIDVIVELRRWAFRRAWASGLSWAWRLMDLFWLGGKLRGDPGLTSRKTGDRTVDIGAKTPLRRLSWGKIRNFSDAGRAGAGE